jgi:non-ribosomal peptide synthetase component F
MTGAGRFQLSPARLELLASLLRTEGVERQSRPLIPRRDDPTAPVPLTFSQSRFWFLDQLAAREAAHIVSAALRVSGEFSFDLFTTACQQLVRRHESLRTVFLERDGQPFQRVVAELPAEVTVQDLRPIAPDAVQARVQDRMTSLRERPFDLAAGPLLRVELLALGYQDAAVLLNVHHIVSDLWSMGVLMKELTEVYGDLVAGRSSTLPELPVQYPDVAAWQRQTASERAWVADLDYWGSTLRDAPTDLALPLDRPRPAERSYRGGTVPVELAPSFVVALRALAQREGVTPFMLLAAAFTATMMRLSGDDDIVVGTPAANRTPQELAPLIGLFVNTLALRIDLRGDPSFQTLLRRVGAVCRGAYEHQDVPFERLVEQLVPQRSLSRTPLFDVMFSYQNVPLPAWGAGSFRIEPIPVDFHKAQFDVLLDLFEDHGTIWGRLEYSTDVFEASTGEVIAHSFERLLRGAVADPRERIGQLSLLSDQERELLIAQGAGPQRSWPDRPRVHRAVQEHARRTPDAPAARCGRESISYAQLNARANRLARRLRRQGVGRGVFVGVPPEGAIEQLVGLLAVLKSGGTWCPVSSGRPPADGRDVLDVRALETEAVTERDDDMDVEVVDDDPACVLVGAAPDGDGTGISITHLMLAGSALSSQDRHGLDTCDRVLTRTVPGSMASVWGIVWPLTAGACVVLESPEAPRDAEGLLRTLSTCGVTTLQLSASMLQALVQGPGISRCPALRRVLAGGEPVSDALREQFFDRSGAELWQVYGTTSSAPDLVGWRLRRDDGPGSVPIGVPSANSQLYVLDRSGQLAPPGIPGELVVDGAPGLVAGRTGELARFRGGALELLGRADHAPPLRAAWAAARAAEGGLWQLEQVLEAAVVVRADSQGEPALVAYLVAGPGADGVASLTTRVHDQLAGWAPSARHDVVLRDALPRTADGSVDRDALPEPEPGEGPGHQQDAPSYLPPRDDVERAVALAWSQILQLAQVGVRDNFFQLGGQSLLALKLASRLNQDHGVQLHVREIFTHQTVEEQAAHLRELRTRGEAEPTARTAGPASQQTGGPAAAPGPRRAPLSFPQEQLCVRHPQGAAYPGHNVVTGLLLRGRLEESALRQTLTDIAQRHQALRTRLVGEPLAQQVDETGSWPLTRVDLRSLPQPARVVELHRLIDAEGARPFRVAAEPLVRGTIAQLPDGEHALILVMHHAVTDNWSYGVLIRDLCELYDAHRGGRPAALPDLATQYPDYATWQREELATGGFDDEVDYWRTQLRDLRPLVLHPLKGIPAEPATGTTLAFAVAPVVTVGLRAIAQRHRASLFMVLLAAFDVLLSAHCGHDDVAVGIKEAGRQRPETAELVGYFVNTLAVRARAGEQLTFGELLDQVRERTLDAYAHPNTPLWADGVLQAGGLDPARIIINLLNAPLPPLRLPDLDVQALDIGDGYVFSEVLGNLEPADVDLALIMREHEGGLRGTWLYSTQAVDPRALTSLMRQWGPLLERVAAEPACRVGDLRRGIADGGTEQPRPYVEGE